MARLHCCLALLAAWLPAATPPQAIPFEGVLSMPSRLPNGTLVSIHAEGATFGDLERERPEMPVYLRTSADHGRTWSAPKQVFTYAAGKGVLIHQVYTMVDRRGGLHAFGVRYYSLPKKEDRSQGHSELLHNVSRDGGLTWTPPQRADFGHGYTGAINSIVALKSGRILAALSYTSDHFVEGVGQIEFRSVAFYSDDEGETWRVAKDDIRVPAGPQVVHPGAIEPVLAELRDGRVWMLIRTQTLRFWECFSSDNGLTWTVPRATRIWAPDSPGAVTRLRDGRLMMAWNDLASYPNGVTGHYRQYLYAALSSDEGKTWSTPRFVGPLEKPDGQGSRGDYPFLCEAADGSVLLYYTRFGLRSGASYTRQHNELVRIDPAWLAEKRGLAEK
ncbi:MAG: sialidase family protein [Bryobacteraceae bacterium]